MEERRCSWCGETYRSIESDFDEYEMCQDCGEEMTARNYFEMRLLEVEVEA